MSRSFRAPGVYVQGEGVVADAAAPLAPIQGEQALVMGGRTALAEVEDDLAAALERAGIVIGHIEGDVDACTRSVIDDGATLVGRVGADVVVGVGGGTAIDAAKAVAAETGCSFVAIPTVASTDAPASGVAVVYDDRGRVADVVLADRNPDAVIVDTAVMAGAPVAFLRHGIGDALATRFEAEATARSGGVTIRGDEPTNTGLAAARRCYRDLTEHGPAAVDAVAQNQVAPAVETVVEANLLLSAVGFENGGLAAAHALEGAFRNAGSRAPHGLVVGFCTLAQLCLEDHEAVEEVRDLLFHLDMAVSLADLGVGETVEAVAELACAHPLMGNEPVSVTEATVAEALTAAEDLLAR